MRVTLRPIASPLPMGFFAFGIGSGMVSFEQLGLVPAADAAVLALLLTVFVFPLEFLAGVFAFLARETIGATALCLIALSWPAAAVVGAAEPSSGTVLGLFYLCIAAVLAVLAVPGLRGKPVLGTVITLAVGRYALNGVVELTGSNPAQVASGVLGLVILAIALYGGVALALEDAQHGAVLPFPRLGESKQAFEGDLADQSATVAREAGVRRQL